MAPDAHVLLFPFMSKGHTIPLIHLAHLLIRRRVTVTVFTTKANRPFIAGFIDLGSIIDLPFPNHVEGLPPGIESTDKLPSMFLFLPFANATKLMQPHFEQVLENLSQHATCIVSDGFLSWTLESANKFGIPRLSFYGMNCYSNAMTQDVGINQLLSGPESDNELITVPRFPWVKVTRNDFTEPFNQRDPNGPLLDFVTDSVITTAKVNGQA